MLVPTAGGDLDLSYANLKWVTNMPNKFKYPEDSHVGKQWWITPIWFSFSSDGTCWRMTHLAKKTETPGRFTFRSQGEQSANINTTALTKQARCKGRDSTAWLLYFCFPQFGTMRTTCALLILCTMTMPWSTQSRQRTECLRSSTSFTVSLRSVTPQQLVLCVSVGGGGFRIEFKHPILCLQVALLRPTLPCSWSSDSSHWRPASSPTTLSSCLRMVCHKYCYACIWAVSVNSTDPCSLTSSICVITAECPEVWGVPCYSSSPALWGRRLSSQKSLVPPIPTPPHPPQWCLSAASQSCTWDNETQAFCSDPCCLPKAIPDPNSDLILYNSRINCVSSERKNKGLVVRQREGMEETVKVVSLLVFFLQAWLF